MAEQYLNLSIIRSYEISIWTLQDRFVSILKWATMDQKGEVQNPQVILRDDGTQEFTFNIPQYYQDGFKRISNPLWIHLDQQPLEANMHKLKVVFNKNTTNEAVFEFLVVSVTEDHTKDEVDITVKAEGLAFHELGKTGYRISLSQENFEKVENDWFDNGYNIETQEWAPRPLMNLQFWNDLIFKDSDGDWRTNWRYEIQMDWSAFSNSELNRKSNILYEDAYVSSWQLDGDDIKPRAVENLREKERPIEISESNYYNVTQTIAKQFGVFCRYAYEHNDRYEITGRKVIYYNNYIKDAEGHIDLTYPYSSQAITRTSDNTSLTTKLYVHSVEDEDYGVLSIMNVDANKSREDYILDFDYLIKIGAINEEQIDDLKQFELDIRRLNDMIIENQERTRIVQNQLVEVSANVTFYDNAVKLDAEQFEQNNNLANSITGGNQMVPIEKVFTVMDGTEKGIGWYINITIEGLDAGSVSLYESRKSTAGSFGTGYSNPISSFQPIFDEYNNVIRLQNLSRNNAQIDDSQIYLIGQYNPKTKYQNIAKTWEQRQGIDSKKLQEASDEEADLNWYLYGSRVGYALAGGTRLDGEYHGIGMLWMDGIGPIPTSNDRDYNQYIDYELDVRILGNQSEVAALQEQIQTTDLSKLSFDYFKDDDAENTTPDLYYYYEIYSKQKEKTVNAFERMMGPALREGYWQPEDYNDYGDVYYDNFILGNEPTTPYLHFIWDHDKYYENEEPVIYTADTAGRMRQHMIIDLTNYLSYLKGHLDRIVFGYYDPIISSTIKELRKNVQNLIDNEVDQIPDTDGATIFDVTYVSIAKLKQYYSGHSFRSYSTIHDIINADGHTEDYYTAALKALFTEVCITDISLYMNTLSDSTIDNDLSEIVQNLNSLVEAIKQLKSLFTSYINAEKELLKSISINNYGEHSITDTTNQNYPGHLQIFNQEYDKADKLYTLTNKVLSWYMYLSSIQGQIETLENNELNTYRTFTIGADCELGWIINKNNQEQKQIPVLIITGTDTLPQNLVEYIQTGVYTYSSSLPDQYNERPGISIINADENQCPFIGYYTGDNNGINTIISIEKLFSLNYNTDFIGDASQLEFTKEVDGAIFPILVSDYPYQRVYPRFYFNSLKLRDTNSKLRLKINQQELVSNEDYYMITDDRSKGILVSGIGYYLTIRSEIFYKYMCENVRIVVDMLYTLLNADTSIYLDAIKVSKENASPKVSYKVQLSILNPEFIQTAYNRLNQIVHINDNDLKLEDVSGYISAVTLQLDKPWEDTVEVKNYQTKFEDLFSTIVAQTEAMKKSEGGISNAVKAFNSYGFIDSDILQDSMLRADLDLAFNKGSLTISQKDGIWGVSESGVVAFRGGGIFTATTKDANNNWNWNTGILPTGINADLITSGQLDTNRIKIYAGDELRFQMNGSGLYAYKGYDEDEYNQLISVTGNDQKEISSKVEESSKKQYLLYNSEGLFLRTEAGAYVLKNEPMYLDENKTLPAFEMGTYTDTSGKEHSYYILDPVTGEKIQKTKPVYSLVESQVDRVEVSWEGFILRNWEGEKVFYADPDTGNLTLKGYVQASGGQIGGWTLYDDRLTSNGISLISGPANAAGIQLSPTGLRQNTVTDYLRNNRTLYIYELVDYTGPVDEEDRDTIYYMPFDSMYDLIVTDSETQLYVARDKMSFAKPLYIEQIQTTGTTEINNENIESGTNPGETYNATSTSVSVTPVNETCYIKESDDAEDVIRDGSGDPIIYDPSDNTFSWLDQIEAAYVNSETDYTTFIDIQYITEYIKYNIESQEELTLRPVGSDEITFQVSAQTGEIVIRSGMIGNVTVVKDQGLSGGTISNVELTPDNKFNVNGQEQEFGMLFYDFGYNDKTGMFTLYRVNGESVNFNIAATQFYKNAIAAAGTLTLQVTVSGNTATYTAEAGQYPYLETAPFGPEYPEKKTKITDTITANSGSQTYTITAKTALNQLSKTITVGNNSSGVSGDGVSGDENTGICVDCKKTCFQSCGKVCTKTSESASSVNCDVNCIGACKATCSGGCKGECLSTCTNNCAEHCSSGCSGSCDNTCKDQCVSCGTSCSTQCKGSGKKEYSCFAPGSLITLCDGTRKSIENIKKGDCVVAYNTNTKVFENKLVSMAHAMKNTPELVKIIFDDKSELIMTPGHPILSTNGWKSRNIEDSKLGHGVEATLLQIGDIIVGQYKNKIIREIIEYNNDDNITVYNATTEDDHTFVVNDIVAHNQKIPPEITPM